MFTPLDGGVGGHKVQFGSGEQCSLCHLPRLRHGAGLLITTQNLPNACPPGPASYRSSTPLSIIAATIVSSAGSKAHCSIWRSV